MIPSPLGVFPDYWRKWNCTTKNIVSFEFRNNSEISTAAFLGKLITDSNFFCLLHEKKETQDKEKDEGSFLGKKDAISQVFKC